VWSYVVVFGRIWGAFLGISGHVWACLSRYWPLLAVISRYWPLPTKESSFPEAKTMDLKYGTTDFSEKIRIFYKSPPRVSMLVPIMSEHVRACSVHVFLILVIFGICKHLWAVTGKLGNASPGEFKPGCQPSHRPMCICMYIISICIYITCMYIYTYIVYSIDACTYIVLHCIHTKIILYIMYHIYCIYYNWVKNFFSPAHQSDPQL
jgi:hypothetical protein